MKYLIISDIHGSLPRLERALSYYERGGFDMLFILGDILNYGPRNSIPEGIDAKGIVARLNPLAADIVAVRGNCDAEVDQILLDFPMMADYALIVDNGKRLLLTHGHIYNKVKLPPGHFDAVFYGHTHLWLLEQGETMVSSADGDDDGLYVESGPVFCNTGSITFPKGGNPPTLATYENGTITVRTLPDDEHPEGTVLETLNIER